jgi:hypothetical protein
MNTLWRLLTWTAAGVLTVAAAVAPLPAQELEALELDDFMDPRTLASDDGRQYRFLAGRIYVGAADKHNFRGDFLRSRVHFGRLATVLYAGRWQVTSKLTDYDTRTRRDPPYFRSRTQVARYFGGRKAPLIRSQLSWSFSQSRTEGAQNEFAFDASTLIYASFLPAPITAGAVYSIDPARDRQFTAASVRAPILRFEHESTISIGASIAHDRDQASNLPQPAFNIFKAELALSIGIPGTETRLYGAYSPAYRRSLEKWNHEITVLLDAAVFAKLFR